MKLSSTPVRVKITSPSMPESLRVWYATSPMVDGCPIKTVALCNKQAKRQGLDSTYELASEADYWAYRESIRAVIAASKAA